MNSVPRLLALLSVGFILTSCSVLTARPQQITSDQRLAMFPRDLPLGQSARIVWTEHLIPVVEARSDSDAALLLGAVHAHLRLGQMSFVRRAVQGRLSESAGRFALDIDHAIRIFDPGKAADSIVASLPPTTFRWLTRYVQGINLVQDHLVASGWWPVDLQALAVEAEPWTVRDIVTFGRLASADVSWFGWFAHLPLVERADWPVLWQALQDFGGASRPSFGPVGSVASFVTGTFPRSGSNAWVVGPSRSASGQALLASDPHLGIQLPNAWVAAGLRTPTLRAVGLTVPGLPLLLLGRTEALAWGGTNLRMQSSDLVRLDSPALADCKTRSERIAVRGWPDQTLDVIDCPHGPILSGARIFNAPDSLILAIRWMGHRPSDEFTPMLQALRSTGVEEWADGFSEWAVSGQNFLLADTAGHILHLLAGRIPTRPTTRPNYPWIDAAASDLAWSDIRGTSDHPRSLNPDRDVLLSTNNRPTWEGVPLSWSWGGDDRIGRLEELIADTAARWTLADMRRWQSDVMAPRHLQLRDSILGYLGSVQDSPRDVSREAFLKRLQGWTGSYAATDTGAPAFQALAYHVVLEVLEATRGRELARSMLRWYEGLDFALRELERLPADSAHRLVHAAVETATIDASSWRFWGDRHKMRLQHTLGRMPVLGSRFRHPDFPSDGGVPTLNKSAHALDVKEHQTFFGAVSRWVVDLAHPDSNFVVLLGGQDGWWGSEQMTDQIDLWRSGRDLHLPLFPERWPELFPDTIRLAGPQDGRD